MEAIQSRNRTSQLVLTRSAGQSVVIGDGIEVCVDTIENGQARLRILAPRSVAVHRSEIYIRNGGTLPSER